MAKFKVSLHTITKEIEKVVRELRAIGKKAGPKGKREIKLDIRGLQRVRSSVKKICRVGAHGRLYDPPVKK
jgi:hypothetical protein